MKKDFLEILKKEFDSAYDKGIFLHELREFIHRKLSGINEPIDFVQWIPVEQVEANTYNPNNVATVEMKLLYISIKKDGYTQPVVTVFSPERKKYVIIDGFHRYSIMKSYPDINKRTNGLLPCVVLNKDVSERMASTVRHNRARGKHAVTGMANLVFKMLDEGMTESEVCNELGMEPEEIVRLKYITGFAKLFENVDYRKAWESRAQIKEKLKYENTDKKSSD